MPISSFYGMQTSLRGLMAQQRMLDTTGHNIANASTQGYSRQEGTLAASQALQLQSAAGPAHLGSGVDVQGFRRVRDQFLDLQFRGQNTGLSDWSAKTDALDTAELALAEPGDNGINAQLTKFWAAWSDVSNAPDSEARQAGRGPAGRLPDRLDQRRAQPDGRREAGRPSIQYDSIAGTGTGTEPERAATSGRSRPSSRT